MTNILLILNYFYIYIVQCSIYFNYKNYILEKIYQKLDKLSSLKSFDNSDLQDTDDFFDLNNKDIPDYNNVKIFDKNNNNK